MQQNDRYAEKAVATEKAGSKRFMLFPSFPRYLRTGRFVV